MKTIETTVTIATDGTLTASVPPDIAPGEHRAVLVIDEQPMVKEKRPPLDFPVIHIEAWPEDLSLRREDMYGDDGR